MSFVLALDLSLTSTGVKYDDELPFRWRPKHTGVERLAFYRHQFGKLLVELAPDLVIVEELPQVTGRGHNMEGTAALHGVWQLKCYDAEIPFTYVHPGKVKRFATGNGNAKKEVVLTDAVRRLGYEGSSDDEADALWMWAMGKAYLGEPVVALPASHLVGLQGIDWQVAK